MGPQMPISILILVDEFEKLVATAILSSLLMFDIACGKSLIVEMDWSECAVRFVSVACFLSIVYGGLAISSLRIIYVKGSFFIFTRIKFWLLKTYMPITSIFLQSFDCLGEMSGLF